MSVMARKSVRKLFLFGRYSLALLLPKKWLRELGVEPGQPVELEFDRARRRIVLRLPTGQSKPPPTKPSKASSEPDSTDLQPIPEL